MGAAPDETRAISNPHTPRLPCPALPFRVMQDAGSSHIKPFTASVEIASNRPGPLLSISSRAAAWTRAAGWPPRIRDAPSLHPQPPPLSCALWWTAMASAGWAWVAEVAGEELAKLEAAHPGRLLGPLKAELQRLVAEPGGLDAEAALPLVVSPPHAGAASDDGTTSTGGATPSRRAGLVCTQESTTRKRKPRGTLREREAEVVGKRRRRASTPPGPPKDSAEMAIERAERCLERIRAVKRSLLAGLPIGFTD
ncbi:hypothetical protein U9M48_009537 [Paspalum notatum var. saurae]|uniref:Uncharacterized protein n=1 Tax=Paspalum notatum var. saurae TaxID=547442 RepID=A0AAQ3WEZ2_PASNO